MCLVYRSTQRSSIHLWSPHLTARLFGQWSSALSTRWAHGSTHSSQDGNLLRGLALAAAAQCQGCIRLVSFMGRQQPTQQQPHSLSTLGPIGVGDAVVCLVI